MNPPPERLGDVLLHKTGGTDPVLNWAKRDCEQRFGFKGGRFTAVNNLFTFFVAAILTVLFYAFTIYGLNRFEPTRFIADMFLLRGPVPYPTMFLTFWCLAILIVKRKKLAEQRKALDLKPFPDDPAFLLNPETAQTILAEINRLVDDTRNFVLLNRIERALSNLRNIGRISDVSDILQTQAEYDEAQQESTFRGFGNTLAVAGEDVGALKDSLGGITGGLSTAFETTLVALVAALVIQLWMTFAQQQESLFLDECSDYCHAHVVSKLRLTED
jgi:hypothetical protein